VAGATSVGTTLVTATSVGTAFVTQVPGSSDSSPAMRLA
jgi:hypothetical protein